MRIFIGTMSYPPNISGVAVAVELVARYLVQNGHEVTVVAPGTKLKSYWERTKAGQPKIYRLRAFPNPVRRGFYLPFFVKGELNALYRQVKPEIVHVNDPMAMSRYLAQAAARNQVPVAVSNHFTLDYVLAYLPDFLKPLVQPYLRRWIVDFYNRCQAVVCPTETVKEKLLALGVQSPIYPVSNGVDLDRFSAYYSPAATRRRFNLPDRPVILYVGRLDKDKSVPVLIAAAARLKPAAGSFQIVLVGGGDARKALRAQAAKHGLEVQVSFVGRVDHDSTDLIALYQLAAIFVMPSSIETQSMSTLEAMAAGKPIVAANGGALPELVKEGVNGLLFPPGDHQALTDSLISLLKSPKKRQRFGRASLKLVAKHELNQCLKLYLNLYQKCRAGK